MRLLALLIVTALALGAAAGVLAAAILAARAAPDALRLLTLLNLPGVLRALTPAALCAAAAVVCATLALLLAPLAAPGARDGPPWADRRSWITSRLERELRTRHRQRGAGSA